MQTPTDFNFEDFQKEAIKGLYSGKPLTVYSSEAGSSSILVKA